jgi:hypothetical protein
MAGSDVKAKRVTGTGAVAIGRARIRHITVLVSDVGAGRLTITDGNGGATLLDVDLSTDLSHTIDIPDEGILATTDPYVSAATNVTAATIFWS